MALKIIGWSMVSRFRASKRWWGGAVDPHAGGLMEADHLPHGGCALVRVAPYPRAQPWGLRPRRHRGFGVVTYVRVPEFTSHSYVHVHTTLSGMCTQHCQPRETRPIAVRLYVCVSYRR